MDGNWKREMIVFDSENTKNYSTQREGQGMMEMKREGKG